MKDLVLKWWNRKWGNWEIFSNVYKYDINRNTDWKMIATLRRISNDGIVEYKTVKNY